MPIIKVTSDPKTLTLTLVGEYPVPVERLWEAYADPRQLERFWGPETWPATFTQHDMAVGGRSTYYMTGPDGTKAAGWWRFVAVDAPRRFEIEDGFSHPDGTDNTALPTTRMTVTLEPTPKGSRSTLVATFPSIAAMEELLAMGMVEGIKSAASQLDGVLADLKSFAADLTTKAQILNDTQVRISRVIRGSIEHVWRAHREAKLLQRWLLGPDGWTMPVCVVAAKVGDAYRFEWEAADGSNRFGFEGELTALDAPHRMVTTERMIGMEGPGTVNVMTLAKVGGGTLLTYVITYPSAEVRDMVLGSGMTEGMEKSYARLETEVLQAA